MRAAPVGAAARPGVGGRRAARARERRSPRRCCSTGGRNGGGAGGANGEVAQAELPWHNPASWSSAFGMRGAKADPPSPAISPPLSPDDVSALCDARGHAPPCERFDGVFNIERSWEVGSVRAGADAPTIVIAPGFGNASSDYRFMVRALEARGFRVLVASVARADWLRVFAAGLPRRDFWAASATPDVAYGWYLRRLESALRNAAQCSGRRAALVGHSAGGWLARSVAASRPDLASHLVTLGTPHFPTPPPGRDMTGGALTSVARAPPLDSGETRVVCVAGRAVVGLEKEKLGAAMADAGVDASAMSAEAGDGASELPWQLLWRMRASESYKEVACTSATAGDGVVPTHYALLGEDAGSESLILDGVFHAMNTPTAWYGSDSVIDAWAHVLCD